MSPICYLCGNPNDDHAEGCLQPILDTLRRDNQELRNALREALSYIEDPSSNSYLDIQTARQLVEK